MLCGGSGCVMGADRGTVGARKHAITKGRPMSEPVLLTISGSLREGSYNRMLCRVAAEAFGPAKVVVGDLDLPLYNGDLESAEGIPAKVQMLADQIAGADAIVISAPEYNKGISGVLKNALDWVSRDRGQCLCGQAHGGGFGCGGADRRRDGAVHDHGLPAAAAGADHFGAGGSGGRGVQGVLGRGRADQ